MMTRDGCCAHMPGCLFSSVDACILAVNRAFPWLPPENAFQLVIHQTGAARSYVLAQRQIRGLPNPGMGQSGDNHWTRRRHATT